MDRSGQLRKAEEETLEQLEQLLLWRKGLRAAGAGVAARIAYFEHLPNEVLIAVPEMLKWYVQVLQEGGRFSDGARICTDCLAAIRRNGPPAPIADTLVHLGTCELYSGDLAAAEARFREALEIRETRLAGDGVHVPLSQLALIEYLRGSCEEAVSWGRRAAAQAIREGDLESFASAHQGLGMYYRELQEYESAAECFERGLETVQLAGEPNAAVATTSIRAEQALLYCRMGDLVLAKALAERAQAEAQLLGASRVEAEIHRVLGITFRCGGELPDARDYLAAALEYAVGGRHPLLEAEVLEEMAALAVQEGKRKEATGFAEGAAERYGQIGSEFRAEGALRRVLAVTP